MNLYVIRDWDKNFEIAQSRKVEGALTWVAVPCKHDGLGFRRIMALEDGPAIYCAWCLIVQVAAKCSVRGRLCDERGPIGPEELAIKTGCGQAIFVRALQVLADQRIGWIVVDEWERNGIHLPTQDRTEQDRTEQNKTDTSDAPPNGGCDSRLLDWIDWWNDLKREGLVAAGVSREPPSEAVKKGWSRVCRSKEVRTLLSDRDVLAREIAACPFLREGWFTLEKLLGGKNRDGAYFAQRILDGGYREAKKDHHFERPQLDPAIWRKGDDG